MFMDNKVKPIGAPSLNSTSDLKEGRAMAHLTLSIRCAPWLIASLCLHTASGWAQSTTACDDREVDREIDRVTEQRERNPEIAALHLRALNGRCPLPRVRGQLGLLEASGQRWSDAYPLLRDALAGTGDGWVTSQRQRLERALSDVEQHMPRLSPQTNVPGAELRVNGDLVGTLPLRSPWVLTGGSGALELTAPGHRPFRRTVSLANGEVFREMLTLEPSTSREPTSTSEPRATPTAPNTSAPSVVGPVSAATTHRDVGSPTRSERSVLAPWIVIGTGIALVGMGGVFWALRSSAVGNCTIEAEAIGCPSDADAIRAQGAAGMGLAANVSFGLGLAATAGGVLWLVLGRSRETQGRSVAIAVVPGPTGAALSAGGTF